MKLSKVLENLDYSVKNSLYDIDNMEVCDIAYDSRKAGENTVFVAIKGETVDGHKYVKNAYDLGCRIFIVNKKVDLADDAVQIFVDDSRKTLSKISANFFDHPSKKMKIIGITGTKGKTTISNYIKSVLCDSGINTGVIGTNGVFYNDVEEKTQNTTPESYELQKIMAKMLESDVKCVTMEVSSGGLMMNRVDDIDFDIGIFTNLSPDHIGPKEHPDFEHYRDCKARLFSLCRHGIVNLDDENAQYMIDHAKCDIDTFSIHRQSHIKADNIKLTRDENSLGADFDCTIDNVTQRVHICSPGEFSIYNALAVIATCSYLGVEQEKMLKALSVAKVSGRVEVLPVLDYATVVLDYAHNGMSLENVLNTLHQYNPKRIITVFGSIGGRSACRRKELGDVAARLCDIAVLTTDNPDNEDPADIIEDIAQSFRGTKCEVYKIVDRKEAIYKALSLAEKGDMVIITGKGHEKYQYINGQRVFYDEKASVIEGAKRVLKEKNAE